MAAEPPSSVAPATATNTKRTPNRKPKTKSAGPSVLNPNWAQLQSKLPASTFLGKRKHRPAPSPPPQPSPDPEAVELTIKLEPTSDDTSLTKALALDCEMVGVGAGGSKSALARVTLFDNQIAINWSTTEGFLSIFKSGLNFDEDLTRMVNSFGNIVYDEFVRPMERIVDYRTHISGIRPKHMNKAKDFSIVQKDVAELITGRVLVGHALHHDLKVLLLGHPKKDIRDTSEYEVFRREGKRRSLKDLAAQELSVNMQQQEHCPIEDARAAMFIYKKHKKGWERNRKDQFRFKNKLKKRGNKKSAEGNEKDPNVTTVLL